MRHLLAIFVILVATASNSVAGGLCGKKGLIRGSVGNWCDKNIEGPVTTPFARNATIVVTTTVGGIVGTALGSPTIGAAVGEYVGETLNERAAGESPAIGRPANHATAKTPAGEATFRIQSSTKYIVYVRLFSQNRKVIWPANRGAYALQTSEPYDLTIQCQVGEKICYGAYYSNKTYWGVGPNDEAGCTDCCQSCDPAGSNFYQAWSITD